jgi:murein DD-endopeptidase MepM/ murein hydrolase activator NlpD
VIEPVPSVPEINNEYQQRLERYLSGGADRLPIPVEGAEISSWYHRDPDGPLKGAIHGAVDIAAPEGTPIKAMYGGVVAYSDKANGYGNFVSILMNEGPYKGECSCCIRGWSNNSKWG